MLDDYKFFQYMEWAEDPHSPESLVNQFAAFILHILKYDEDYIIGQRWETPFPMAGQWVNAETGMFMLGEVKYLRLVHAGKVSC